MPSPVAPARRRSSLLAWALVTLVAVLVVVLGVLAYVKVPYVVMSPGPVTDTIGEADQGGHPVVSVKEKDGIKVYEPEHGHLGFTTVSVQGGPAHPLSALGYLWATFDDDAVIKKTAEVFPPNVSADEIKQQDKMMMAQSQDGAHIVAARAAGLKVDRTVGVAGVLESSPNKDVLKPGDDLLRAGGKSLTSLEDLRTTLGPVPVGGTLPMTIRRDGKQQDVLAKIMERDGRKVLGIEVRYQYSTPLEVTFDAGSVGGPSAGLILTLAVYDKLTPGDLTGGQYVAGTGTIDGEGKVGPIGGIEFKLKGAKDAGATWFLAPSSNCADIRGHEVAGLRVIPVETFDDAKKAVGEIAAGNTGSLPSCPAS